MDWNTQLTVLGEILLAMVLGGVIGFEREAADKPAGLRTHMLIAGAATLMVFLGSVIIAAYGSGLENNLVSSDPIRVIEAIIVGISFLGAGTIVRQGGKHVYGLTTAGTVLFTASIGVAVALQQFAVAIGGTFMMLIVLRVVAGLERRIWGQE